MKINPDHDPYRSLKVFGVIFAVSIVFLVIISRNDHAPTIAEKNLDIKIRAWQDSLVKYEGGPPSTDAFKKEKGFRDSLAKYSPFER
jgi:hypothetical protein